MRQLSVRTLASCNRHLGFRGPGLGWHLGLECSSAPSVFRHPWDPPCPGLSQRQCLAQRAGENIRALRGRAGKAALGGAPLGADARAAAVPAGRALQDTFLRLWSPSPRFAREPQRLSQALELTRNFHAHPPQEHRWIHSPGVTRDFRSCDTQGPHWPPLPPHRRHRSEDPESWGLAEVTSPLWTWRPLFA